MTLQAIFAELVLIQTLHARISDQVTTLDSALSDIPLRLQEVKLVVLQSLQVLRAALQTLDQQLLVAYLTIHRRLAVFIDMYGHLPPIDNIDGSDDSQP